MACINKMVDHADVPDDWCYKTYLPMIRSFQNVDLLTHNCSTFPYDDRPIANSFSLQLMYNNLVFKYLQIGILLDILVPEFKPILP
jgi:hypothetical protein